MAGGGGGVGKEGAVVVVSEKPDSFIRFRSVEPSDHFIKRKMKIC
jgi:hypothetical protein